jgi:dihydrofolate reductase
MASTVLYMSMSVDGFITGPNESPENALGDGGHRLHEWALGTDAEQAGHHGAGGDLSGADREIWVEMMSTGAVLAGRGTFEPAGGWGGDHHNGVPIFILSRHEPGPEFARMPKVTYLSDLESAVAQAKEAAGDKDVLVHGSSIARWTLAAGLLDELQIHLVPVLLGEGRRLFEELGTEQRQLETIRVAQGRDATHLRYRVRR